MVTKATSKGIRFFLIFALLAVFCSWVGQTVKPVDQQNLLRHTARGFAHAADAPGVEQPMRRVSNLDARKRVSDFEVSPRTGNIKIIQPATGNIKIRPAKISGETKKIDAQPEISGDAHEILELLRDHSRQLRELEAMHRHTHWYVSALHHDYHNLPRKPFSTFLNANFAPEQSRLEKHSLLEEKKGAPSGD